MIVIGHQLGAATVLHSNKQENQGACPYTFVLLCEKQRLWGPPVVSLNDGGLCFPTVEMEDDDFTASLSKQSCITEQTQYFFDNDSKSFSGVLDCGNCSR